MYLCEGQKWDLEFEVRKRDWEVLQYLKKSNKNFNQNKSYNVFQITRIPCFNLYLVKMYKQSEQQNKKVIHNYNQIKTTPNQTTYTIKSTPFSLDSYKHQNWKFSCATLNLCSFPPTTVTCFLCSFSLFDILVIFVISILSYHLKLLTETRRTIQLCS